MYDYNTYLDWYRFTNGGDAGTFTGVDPSKWAYDSFHNNRDQTAFRQNISPYLGKEIEARLTSIGDPAGEGGEVQQFYEFRDPITGLWRRSEERADQAERTSYTYGTGGISNRGKSQTSNGDWWIMPSFTVQQKDGKWYLDNGSVVYDQDKSRKYQTIGVLSVLGAAIAGAAAAAGSAGSAGGAGAVTGAEGVSGTLFGDAGMMYAGADAGAAGSLGMGGLTGTEVLAGAGGGLGTTIPGAGWAEAVGAEQAMGGMVLDAAPIGAGTTAAAGGGGGLLSSVLPEGVTGSSLIKYIPGLLSGIAAGTSKGGTGGRGELDPRVAAAIFGDGKNNKGALNFAQGLLNAPVAPNGFERFYGRG